MREKCSICNHPEREKIDAAIVAGMPLSRIAPDFSTSDRTLRRHRDECLKSALQAIRSEASTAPDDAETRHDSARLGTDLEDSPPFDALSEMDWMRKETRGLYQEMLAIKEYRFALQALAELRRQNELCAKLVGELDEHSITITAIPEWRELRALLLDALSQHPVAKMAVIRALEAYDHQSTA